MELYEYLIEKSKKDNIVKNVVGAVIINNEKNILILKRKKDDFMGGIQELPSGNMENGESIYDSLKREIKEETNLDVEHVCMYINSFDYNSSSGKKSRQFNFLVKVYDCSSVKLTEHDEYNWLNEEEIKNNSNITDETKFAINIALFNLNN